MGSCFEMFVVLFCLAGKVKTSWNFEGLNMKFDPEKWEVCLYLELQPSCVEYRRYH